MPRYDLARYMQRKKLTNANQLADYAHITVPKAYRVLSGASLEKIDVATLRALAKAFGVATTPWKLLDWDD